MTDNDLLNAVRVRDRDHLRAISLRHFVSEVVSDEIVERGDDLTLSVLLSNHRAEHSRDAHEAGLDRAFANPNLHCVVVDRRSLPIDLLNEMYFAVEARLRTRILRKNRHLNPDSVDAALAAGHYRLATRDGVLPADYGKAEAKVQALKATGSIGPEALAAFVRSGQTTQFLITLADMASVEFLTARWIVERRQLDALAIIRKAAGFDRALFLTLAVTILDREADVVGQAREYGALYSKLDRETADRTVRF